MQLGVNELIWLPPKVQRQSTECQDMADSQLSNGLAWFPRESGTPGDKEGRFDIGALQDFQDGPTPRNEKHLSNGIVEVESKLAF